MTLKDTDSLYKQKNVPKKIRDILEGNNREIGIKTGTEMIR
ncbi:MAG: hypothetical protein R3D71_01750 [Rickettsiales bacterium]